MCTAVSWVKSYNLIICLRIHCNPALGCVLCSNACTSSECTNLALSQQRKAQQLH